MSKSKYTIEESPNGCEQMCIQAQNLPVKECQRIRMHVLDNWIDSPWYKAKDKAHPFLQGYDENSGWILVEFWTSNREGIQAFVDMLNEEV